MGEVAVRVLLLIILGVSLCPRKRTTVRPIKNFWLFILLLCDYVLTYSSLLLVHASQFILIINLCLLLSYYSLSQMAIDAARIWFWNWMRAYRSGKNNIAPVHFHMMMMTLNIVRFHFLNFSCWSYCWIANHMFRNTKLRTLYWI